MEFSNTVSAASGKRKFRELKDLNLMDDFLFGKLAQEADNEELIRDLIATLLGHIVECQKQHVVDKNPESHGIRLDAYVKDSKGTIYDVEVQVEPKYNLPRRMRYCQGLMDSEQMPAGEFNYSKLPDSIIIFICNFDPYGKGWYRYAFKNLCVKDPEVEFGGEFMSLEEKLYHSRVEGREQGRVEGRKEGAMEEKIRTARTLRAMKMPVAEIAKILSIPVDMATEIIEKHC